PLRIPRRGFWPAGFLLLFTLAPMFFSQPSSAKTGPRAIADQRHCAAENAARYGDVHHRPIAPRRGVHRYARVTIGFTTFACVPPGELSLSLRLRQISLSEQPSYLSIGGQNGQSSFQFGDNDGRCPFEASRRHWPNADREDPGIEKAAASHRGAVVGPIER